MTPEQKREYMKRWRAAHPGYHAAWNAAHDDAAAQRRRRAADPERFRQYRRTYRQANPGKVLQERAYTKEWRMRNRDRLLEFHRSYDLAHREEKRIKRLARYQANTEALRARRRAWTEAHPDQVRAAARAYQKSHLEQRSHLENRRRARRAGNGGSHTMQEWLEKLDLFATCCVYCGERRPLVRDHDMPLVRGGTDDIANILPACRSCNNKKYTLTAREYLARPNSAMIRADSPTRGSRSVPVEALVP